MHFYQMEFEKEKLWTHIFISDGERQALFAQVEYLKQYSTRAYQIDKSRPNTSFESWAQAGPKIWPF